MGSYIGIVLVYNNSSQNKIECELRTVIRYLIFHEGNITNTKYSKDKDGIKWVEDSFTNGLEIEKVSSLLSKNYFGQLNVICNILNMKKLNICVTMKNTDKNYFGILLDIAEDDLMGVISNENIDIITERIIYLLKDLYEVSDFDYAFCDNEAEILYSPSEFQSLNEKVYSVVALPIIKGEKKIVIVKSNWNIDGLTTRTI